MAAQFQLTAHRVSAPPGIPVAHLGESPSWDDEHGVLWWIDIIGEMLFVGQPAPGSIRDFDRVAVLPLKGHRVGFVVHTTAPAPVPVNGVGQAAAAAVPFHAIWGSQSGLYYTSYSSALPWFTSGKQSSVSPLTKTETAGAAPHRRLAEFPGKSFALHDGRIYRFNDGKVGPDGSLWAGGMMERSAKYTKRDPESGVLTQWTPTAQNPSAFRVGVPKVTVSNGMGWSPAGDVLYHVDTPTGMIRAYPYHRDSTPAHIDPSESYVFWTLPTEQKQRGATLDGLCVDAAGAVWVALAGIGEVVRLQARKRANSVLPPQVSITGVVTIPGASLSTSCCFGGADLTTLYITTARGTSPEAVAKCTQAGAGYVYAVNLKGIAKGMPASRLQLPPGALSHL